MKMIGAEGRLDRDEGLANKVQACDRNSVSSLQSVRV